MRASARETHHHWSSKLLAGWTSALVATHGPRGTALRSRRSDAHGMRACDLDRGPLTGLPPRLSAGSAARGQPNERSHVAETSSPCTSFKSCVTVSCGH
eukprot:5584004-Prymnesium_polylepis.1